jgi:uncharacterized phage protein (TIGR01671 family)
MREIKFRGWDAEEEKIYYFDLLTCMTYNEMAQDELCSYEAKNNLMQYTGLKDMNEKEIYEGDILKVENMSSERGIWKVYFDSGTFVCERTRDQNVEELIDIVLDCEAVKHCEVIGNIYEQPEFLTIRSVNV